MMYFRKSGHVCIFLDVQGLRKKGFNWSRMASQAASYRLGIKQNRDKEILRTIPIGKLETSDFFKAKFRCFV